MMIENNVATTTRGGFNRLMLLWTTSRFCDDVITGVIIIMIIISRIFAGKRMWEKSKLNLRVTAGEEILSSASALRQIIMMRISAAVLFSSPFNFSSPAAADDATAADHLTSSSFTSLKPPHTPLFLWNLMIIIILYGWIDWKWCMR